MRNKLAKKLKLQVALAMYVGDDVTVEDVKKDRKTVYASDDFKPVYRARKRNHKRTEQVVKNIKIDMPPAAVIKIIREARERKAAFGKMFSRPIKRMKP